MVRTYLGGMLLPVNPLDEVTCHVQGNNKQYEIVAIGDITKLGNRKLMTIEIKSIFPSADYPFSVGGDSPASYVQAIQQMMDSQSTTRLMMTGDGMDINLRCTIEDFKPTQKFGETGDYYYTLSLKEYRSYSAKRLNLAPASLKNSTLGAQKQRQEEPQKAGSYTVKEGDCLWTIAQQFYGSGADYNKIYEANKDKIGNPNLIYPGQTFTLP